MVLCAELHDLAGINPLVVSKRIQLLLKGLSTFTLYGNDLTIGDYFSLL